MFKLVCLGAAGVLTGASAAHAADDYLSQIYGKDATKAEWSAQAKPKPAEPRAAKKDNCDSMLGGTPFVAGSSLEVVATDNPVKHILRNQPIIVSREVATLDGDENRLAQLAKMREFGQEVANLILSPEYFGSEDAQLKIQTLLQTEVGLLPKKSLAVIGSNLDVSLSELNGTNQKPRYRRDADNALAELTRVVTHYRKNGLDINSVANFSARLADIPLFGRAFKGLDVVLRERFQTVKEVIAVNDQVFELSIAQMLTRHEQMKAARLECRALERYLELSLAVVEEVGRLASEYLQSTNPTKEQQARFEQLVQKPLAMTEQFILRNQTVVMAAYHQNAILMNNLLDFIAVIRNVRTTAELSITTFGAGAIEANEQEKSMNLARDTITAVDQIASETIARIRKQGVRVREFPHFIIKSTSEMIGHIDSLIAELELVQESGGETLRLMDRANSIFKVRLEDARKKGAKYDLIRLADAVVDSVAPRRSSQIDETPGRP